MVRLMFTVLTLIGGLIFVALGGAALLRGTAGLALAAGVPHFIIGLAIVAFGTSTPQLFTALQASYSGAAEMAVATAVGSSIFNIFATLGVVAISGGAVHLNKRIWVRGNIGLTLIALIAAGTVFFFALSGVAIPRWVGALALLLLVGYVVAAYAYDHKHPTPIPFLKDVKKLHPAILGGFFASGLFGLILGANLLVDAANQLTLTHGLNPRFLGLTVLAIGTALPQLVASMVAFQDKQHAMLLSNLIGNTIFNLLGICGLLLALNTVTIPLGGLVLTSLMVLAGATIAFMVFTHPSMRRFKRAEAILFILAYILYLAYMVHSL